MFIFHTKMKAKGMERNIVNIYTHTKPKQQKQMQDTRVSSSFHTKQSAQFNEQIAAKYIKIIIDTLHTYIYTYTLM